jgi:hypothetical protein
MKTNITILMIMCSFLMSFSQNSEEKTSFTYGEFKAGYGVSIFGKGLKERYTAGNFSTSGGGVYNISAFRKFKKVNHLNFGLKFKALGAAPAKNNNGDEMFFNYWGAAISTKYFPFNKEANKGFVLIVDYFFVTQFTQKYRNQVTKFYDHQFAIGSGAAGGIGYEFMAFKNQFKGCFSIDYEMDSRRGEVNNVGHKTFISQSIAATLGFKF